MNNLATTALIGTGQLGNKELVTETPVDTLTAQLLDSERERVLLLAAGALAVYKQAGHLPDPAPEGPLPAQQEAQPACSPRFASLLEEFLHGKQRELLPEALQRLEQSGKRLPFALLPTALNYGAKSREIRSLLIPVLGKRGVWLSSFEPDWSWASHFLLESDLAQLDDVETIWQEGTLGQRRQVLERLRTINPAQARQWLTDVWKKERAEARLELLSTLQVALSDEDEPFLEQALDDRSSGVREAASLLLARLPNSALIRRMIERADTMLHFQDGWFLLTSPARIDSTWQRDGIAALAEQSTAVDTQYLWRVFSLVPLAHWEQRSGLTPAELIAAAPRDNLGDLLIKSWAYAAQFSISPDWLEPLWAWWCRNPSTSTIRNVPSTTLFTKIAAQLPQHNAEQHVLQRLAQQKSWEILLTTLPRPWSEHFAQNCLEVLRSYIRELDPRLHLTYDWQEALTAVALALPPACFDAACLPWQLPGETTWQVQQWQDGIVQFTALIQTRKHILEEIH